MPNPPKDQPPKKQPPKKQNTEEQDTEEQPPKIVYGSVTVSNTAPTARILTTAEAIISTVNENLKDPEVTGPQPWKSDCNKRETQAEVTTRILRRSQKMREKRLSFDADTALYFNMPVWMDKILMDIPARRKDRERAFFTVVCATDVVDPMRKLLSKDESDTARNYPVSYRMGKGLRKLGLLEWKDGSFKLPPLKRNERTIRIPIETCQMHVTGAISYRNLKRHKEALANSITMTAQVRKENAARNRKQNSAKGGKAKTGAPVAGKIKRSFLDTMTDAKLAEELGVTRRTIQRWKKSGILELKMSHLLGKCPIYSKKGKNRANVPFTQRGEILSKLNPTEQFQPVDDPQAIDRAVGIAGNQSNHLENQPDLFDGLETTPNEPNADSEKNGGENGNAGEGGDSGATGPNAETQAFHDLLKDCEKSIEDRRKRDAEP